jgi:hypothetical protein
MPTIYTEDYFIPFAINKQLKCLLYFALPKIRNEFNATPNPITFKFLKKKNLR